MRKTITEEKELVVCDVCGYRVRDEAKALMNICSVCGREYCMNCEGRGSNPFLVEICKDCREDPKVDELVDATLPKYHTERKALIGQLKALNITKKTRDREKEWEGEVK
jgi:hypothetical protein